MPKKHHRPAADPAGEEDNAIRPMWSGTLSFGLVSVPVDLYAGTRGGGAPLRMLAPDGTPVARRFFCPKDDTEVPSDHLVRGFDRGEGNYVVITDEELEALAPDKSRDIDLRLFIAGRAIDPVYYERAFFLAPSGESTKAYRLLAEVMEETDRIGIATFVMREREYLIALLARDGLLHALALRFAEQVRSTGDLELPASAAARKEDVDRFVNQIRTHATPSFQPKNLRNEAADALRKLAAKKARDPKNRIESPLAGGQDDGAEVVDLMEVLKRSLGRQGARSLKRSLAPAALRRAERRRSPRKAVRRSA